MKKLYPEESIQKIANAIRSKQNKNLINLSAYSGAEWVDDESGGYYEQNNTNVPIIFTSKIPFDSDATFSYSYRKKKVAGTAGSFGYIAINPLDSDGYSITPYNVLAISNTNLYYLAEDLSAGDTMIRATSLTGWDTSSQYGHNVMFFGYADSSGYVYPDGTYTRNVYNNIYSSVDAIDFSASTITLKDAWTGNAFKKGTCFAQSFDGATYLYLDNGKANDDWTTYTGYMSSSSSSSSDIAQSSLTRLKYAKYIEVRTHTNMLIDLADIDIHLKNTTKMKVTEMASALNNVESRYTIEQIAGRDIRGAITPNVQSIGQSAFFGCSMITSVSAPNVQSIGPSAFFGCSMLTSVSAPNVQSIGQSAFYGCTKLKEADFPRLKIGANYIFYNANKLKSFNAPLLPMVYRQIHSMNSVLKTADYAKATSIALQAFEYCYSLTALILRSETLCNLENVTAFNQCMHVLGIQNATFNPTGAKDGYIYVPSALLDSYKTATNWTTYASQFRALEDYTVDGTINGELDESKI